jgi:putative phosphoesterase
MGIQMRVGLITDTHIPDIASVVPSEVAQVFEGVELILHAGDIYDISVIDELEKIAPVLAALGDDDSFRLLQDERIEMKHVLKLEGHTVWLIHERPLWYRVTPQQAEEAPAVIVHGHSHDAKISDDNGTLFIGSGSPTFLHYRRGLGTVAILDITAEGAEASIVRL